MAKLKNLIKQLSDEDYVSILNSLEESSADKSSYLLQAMRERQLSDNKVMVELGVNTNAYYTLRSRLNQKIEEYLLQQMESPRTDILRKVANINEIVFTKKKAIAVATLKKLEKELLDYDLSNELTIVYKSLKKLNIYPPGSIVIFASIITGNGSVGIVNNVFWNIIGIIFIPQKKPLVLIFNLTLVFHSHISLKFCDQELRWKSILTIVGHQAAYCIIYLFKIFFCFSEYTIMAVIF